MNLNFGFLAQSPAPIEPGGIDPPIDLFPYPLWMVITTAIAVCAFLALIVWLIVRWLRSRAPTPPPLPREVALQQLSEAGEQIDSLDPHAFSITVSDILRTYLTAQYNLPATQQTSPEFLADLQRSLSFTVAEKSLLEGFLEKCDLIKFARIDATTADSAALLDQAIRFVKGSW